MARKKVKVMIDVLTFMDGEFFIIYSPTLDLSAYGRTLRYAQKSFKDSLKTIIEELKQKNSLISYLLSHGWTIRTTPLPELKPSSLKEEFIKKLIPKARLMQPRSKMEVILHI